MLPEPVQPHMLETPKLAKEDVLAALPKAVQPRMLGTFTSEKKDALAVLPEAVQPQMLTTLTPAKENNSAVFPGLSKTTENNVSAGVPEPMQTQMSCISKHEHVFKITAAAEQNASNSCLKSASNNSRNGFRLKRFNQVTANHNFTKETSGSVPRFQKVCSETVASSSAVKLPGPNLNLQNSFGAHRGGKNTRKPWTFKRNFNSNVPLSCNTKVSDVFGVHCFRCLQNTCNVMTHLQANKPPVENDTIYNYLQSASQADVNKAYRFMYANYPLYKKYFATFCFFCVSRNDRSKLFSMIEDCRRYPNEYSANLMLVYECIVRCGMARVTACQTILQRVPQDICILDALVAIIAKSDWTQFTDYILQYAKMNYNFCLDALNEMSAAVLQARDPTKLKQVLSECILTLQPSDAARICSYGNLIQCLPLFYS